VTKSESSRWQQVAAVPAVVRAEYVEEAKATVRRGEHGRADAARRREGGGRRGFADALERYPFLRDVPGHAPARLLEIAATLDAAGDDDRPAMEEQARRWCDAQRELVPQWKAEDRTNSTVDAVIDHLLKVNVILGKHAATDIADAIVGRTAPANDIEIVRSAAQRVGDLARAVASHGGSGRIRRVK
jgi:hypothetical protein